MCGAYYIIQSPLCETHFSYLRNEERTLTASQAGPVYSADMCIRGCDFKVHSEHQVTGFQGNVVR